METHTKLRKKSLTMVEEAIEQVKGFKELYCSGKVIDSTMLVI